MSQEYVIVFCACPNLKTAENLAELLVENALAACVNILPSVHSVFYWQGKIEKTEETLLIIKTMQTYYSEVETMIKKHHPYELPELIGVSIDKGSPDYFTFIQQSLERKHP